MITSVDGYLLTFWQSIENDKQLCRTLDSITTRPLMKIFARFPLVQGKVWFHDLMSKMITTDNPLNYIVPINPKTGLIMISYTDSISTLFWQKKKNLHSLQVEIMSQLKKVFPGINNIPKSLWIHGHYWAHGAHYILPNYVKYNDGKTTYNCRIP